MWRVFWFTVALFYDNVQTGKTALSAKFFEYDSEGFSLVCDSAGFLDFLFDSDHNFIVFGCDSEVWM